MLESIWVFTSYPDAYLEQPRRRFCPQQRHSGYFASVAVSEAYIYGRQNEHQAFNTIHTVKARCCRRPCGSALTKKWRNTDELPAMADPSQCRRTDRTDHATGTRAGFADGPHVALAFELEQIWSCNREAVADELWRAGIGVWRDLGFSPREYYRLSLSVVFAGMLPCYIESADKPEGTAVSHCLQRHPVSRPAAARLGQIVIQPGCFQPGFSSSANQYGRTFALCGDFFYIP